jgi:hypothetical protein
MYLIYYTPYKVYRSIFTKQNPYQFFVEDVLRDF